MMTIEITPGKVLRVFGLIITFLLMANVIGIILRIHFDHDYVYGLINLFDFDTERNIPTLYSSIALVLASVLLFLISIMHRRKNEPYLLWGILSFIFLFLSIDEISSIHETLVAPTKELFGTSGLLYFAWVIPYGIALVFFVISYFRFLLVLPKRIMKLFIISGGVFVLGAIGFEMIGGQEAELNGNKGLLYSIFYTCEEFLEMLGIVIFIYTLLMYVLTQKECIKINLSKNKQEI